MPNAAARLCPGCRNRVVGKCTFCEAKRQKNVNSRRTIDDAFYRTGAWQLIRVDQLRRKPFCQAILADQKPCNKIANHVDHIVARCEGGSDEPDNLQSLCASCHSRKTVLENGGFGRRH